MLNIDTLWLSDAQVGRPQPLRSERHDSLQRLDQFTLDRLVANFSSTGLFTGKWTRTFGGF
jgi:hypothetical protein